MGEVKTYADGWRAAFECFEALLPAVEMDRNEAANEAMEEIDLKPNNVTCPWCKGIHFWENEPYAWILHHEDDCRYERWRN